MELTLDRTGALHYLRKMNKVRVASIGWLMIAACAFGADQGDWSRVMALQRGKRIGVVTATQKIEGRFQAATDNGITILADREVTAQRDEVRSVYTRGRFNRWTRALIGAGAGAVAGVILNNSVGSRFSNEGLEASAPIVGLSTMLGAGIGALTGSGKHTIYRKP